MYVKTLKFKKIYCIFFALFVIVFVGVFFYYSVPKVITANAEEAEEQTDASDLPNTEEQTDAEKKKYIKWVEFKPSCTLLNQLSKLDIASHTDPNQVPLNWIEMLSYLACKYGGDFHQFKQSDLDHLVSQLRSGKTMEELTQDMKNYPYFHESYDAVLNQFIGEYEIETTNETGEKQFTKKYGIKAFLPIAKNYSFSHYDDFGNSRSYGYRRKHLGNDLMGSIGTPIIAVESGTIEAAGWNQYGGWRIGIRSFDKKRYYYYAHLRKDHPFNKEIYEGKVVKAGDVIGYLGMTGYSSKENVNNINVPHLHFGIQLIFDESQKEGTNQIWIDVYQIIEFLKKNRSEVYVDDKQSKDYDRKFDIMDPNVCE